MTKWIARAVVFVCWPLIAATMLVLVALAMVICWPLTLTPLVKWDI